MYSKRFLHSESIKKKHKLNVFSKVSKINYFLYNWLTLVLGFSFAIVTLYLGFFSLAWGFKMASFYFSMLLDFIKENPFLFIILSSFLFSSRGELLNLLKFSPFWYFSFFWAFKIERCEIFFHNFLVKKFSFILEAKPYIVNNPRILLIISLIGKVSFYYNLIYSCYIKYKKVLFIITVICNISILFYSYITSNLTLNEITEFFLFLIALYNIYSVIFKGVSITKSSRLNFLFLFCNVLILIFCWHSFISVILHIFTFIKNFQNKNAGSPSGSNQPGPSGPSGPSGPNEPNDPVNISPNPEKKNRKKLDLNLMTPEEREKRERKREIDRISLRKKRDNMTEEQKKTMNEKTCISERKRRANMTSDDRLTLNGTKRSRREYDIEIRNSIILEKQIDGLIYRKDYNKTQLDIWTASRINVLSELATQREQEENNR